ncbi:MAG: LexA family protein, partial [Nitrospiraceae bacterium]
LELLIDNSRYRNLVAMLPPLLLGGETFALGVKGESMREDGILPGDVVVVRNQGTSRNGQTVVSVAAFPIPPIESVRASLTVRRRGSTPLARMIEGLDHGQKTRPS